MASGEKLGGRTCAEVSDTKQPSRSKPENEKKIQVKKKITKSEFFRGDFFRFKPSLISKEKGWASKFV